MTLRELTTSGPRCSCRCSLIALVVAAGGCSLGDGDDSNASDPASVSQGIVGPAPDYIVTSVSNPPAAAVNGTTFPTTSTVQNAGDAAAAADCTTRRR